MKNEIYFAFCSFNSVIMEYQSMWEWSNFLYNYVQELTFEFGLSYPSKGIDEISEHNKKLVPIDVCQCLLTLDQIIILFLRINGNDFTRFRWTGGTICLSYSLTIFLFLGTLFSCSLSSMSVEQCVSCQIIETNHMIRFICFCHSIFAFQRWDLLPVPYWVSVELLLEMKRHRHKALFT